MKYQMSRRSESGEPLILYRRNNTCNKQTVVHQCECSDVVLMFNNEMLHAAVDNSNSSCGLVPQHAIVCLVD